MVADPVRLSTAEALHARITGAILRKRQADYDLALMLRDFWEAQLFRELGYISIAEYGEQAHGLGRQKTRALLRLAGAMRDLPELSEAVESGALPWTKAREVARVAASDTVEEWVEHAATVTNRELENLVRHARAGDSVARARERRAESDDLRTFSVRNLSADQHDLLEQLLERIRQDSGIDREDFSRGDALVTAAQRVLAELDSNDVSAMPPSRVRFQRVLHVCTECDRAEGETGTPHDTDVAMSVCDCEVIDLRPVPETSSEPDASHKCTRGTQRKSVRPTVKRAVLHRDRHQCVVPRCRNRLYIDVHHVVPRSQGGAHTEDNLISLCGSHHHLLHDGRLAIRHTTTKDVLDITFPDGRRDVIALGERR